MRKEKVMGFTDLKDKALNCANYYPEDTKVTVKLIRNPDTGRSKHIYRDDKVMKCCLEDNHREYYQKMDMCGTVACPFYKPQGTANQVRKEKRNAVWFEPLKPEQEEWQMTPQRYKAHYERLHNGKRKRKKAERND